MDFVGFLIVVFLGYFLGSIKILMGFLGIFLLGSIGGVIIVVFILGFIGKIGFIIIKCINYKYSNNSIKCISVINY